METLTLEVNQEFVAANTTFSVPGVASLVVTPPLDEDYWLFRVKLHNDQAMLGFPKFGVIGVGFAQEEDWNTNLPSGCDADKIYKHIKHNKKYDEITDEMCLEAIKLIQDAANALSGEKKGV